MPHGHALEEFMEDQQPSSHPFNFASAGWEWTQQRWLWLQVKKGSGEIDLNINTPFIQAIVDCVWNNEMTIHANLSGQGKIPDEAFTRPIITECMKGYWRNIYKQCNEQSSAHKLEKVKEHKDHGRHRSHCQNVSKSRQKAAIKFKEETGNHGAVATINTNFISDILSCGESDLRWEWERLLTESLDFNGEVSIMKDSSSEGAKDVAVDPPTVQDDPINKWKEEHPDMKVLEGVPWLKGFYEQLKDSGDIFEEDHTYLQELDEWHI
ncbi:hypothetical protein BDR05DRAFT_952951 [Suillus weaverae]|nr:hypothetical protein BDR05DRAFT_952951 [Suillus weaverae]